VQGNSRTAEAIAAFRRGELDRARALAQAQLDDAQGPAEIHHLLGLVECRAGRIESGVGHLRAALDAEPGNMAFRVMLARALIDAGRAQDALEVAAAPKETSPAALALWHARAEAAQLLGQHAVAADAWKILCAGRPGDWRMWANYGEALAGLERWGETANALRQARILNPRELDIQKNLAAALTKAGLHSEAADQLREMLDSGHEDIRARLTLARLYADLGRNEEAMDQFDKAAGTAVDADRTGSGRLIEITLDAPAGESPIDDVQIGSVRELAMLLERTSRNDALRELLEDALRLGIPEARLGYPLASIALRNGDAARAKVLLLAETASDDPVRWHALMARIAEANGDPATAFAEAEAMHHAVPDRPAWLRRAESYIDKIRGFAAAVTPEWVDRLEPLSPKARRSPAFLVGFPRSGTTLLDTFLMGHPDTCIVEEQQMLNAAEKVAGDYSPLPERPPERLEQARETYFAELDRHVPPGFGGLVVDKLPLSMLGLPLIYRMFPDARVIFAQRHPCDVVLSGFMQGFALNDAMACFLELENAARFYDSAMGLFWKARELLPLNFHTLIYENLVADPETSLKPIIAFLGLEWHPELLDHRATAIARGAISTPSYGQVVQPLSTAPSGRWRRYREQLAPVLPVLLPWAERLGYAD
jgi:tetratricopeptide (TPR) repeat protein